MSNISKYSFVFMIWVGVGFLLISAVLFTLTSYDAIELNKKQDALVTRDYSQMDSNRQLSISKPKQVDKDFPFGTFERLKYELEEGLNYPFEVSTDGKELGINIFFNNHDLSNKTNELIKLVITNTFSAMHKAKFKTYNNVTLKFVSPLVVHGKNNSQINIVTARYDATVVILIPWHEIEHIDMYHIADKLELHPDLK